jgi:hypothetical protein
VKLKVGDRVRYQPDVRQTGTWIVGWTGHITRFYRANADYERRAVVAAADGREQVLAVKWLVPE